MARLGVVPWNCQAAPGWCSWLPFADHFEACRVPTEAEIRACQIAEIGPAMMPANVQAAILQGDAMTVAYCSDHPDECQAYQNVTAGVGLSPAVWLSLAVLAAALLMK